MPRPQLKLPKKVSPPSSGVELDTSAVERAEVPPLSSSVPKYAVRLGGALNSASDRDSDNLAAAVSLNLDDGSQELDEKTFIERSLMYAKKIEGRFRPLNMKYFARYAKNLSRLTDERMMVAGETLARIYGYQNLRELTSVLSEPGEAGPFDDAISDDEWEDVNIQIALEIRWHRVFQVIAERVPRLRFDANTLYSDSRLEEMSLFSTPHTHFSAVDAMNLPPYISESAYRKMRLGATEADE